MADSELWVVIPVAEFRGRSGILAVFCRASKKNLHMKEWKTGTEDAKNSQSGELLLRPTSTTTVTVMKKEQMSTFDAVMDNKSTLEPKIEAIALEVGLLQVDNRKLLDHMETNKSAIVVMLPLICVVQAQL
ncbi:hypothetical protein NDU88_002672 [Pleurodeles waltl]|uniref:Uncharacterized protein n=1 Tax=Pleurodeles waltl TaxID=8319 RepID=A0AAV7WLV3_PLEWA|nr:hypothetical protein NDU88_002672 [Pleurodeles waltl]